MPFIRNGRPEPGPDPSEGPQRPSSVSHKTRRTLSLSPVPALDIRSARQLLGACSEVARNERALCACVIFAGARIPARFVYIAREFQFTSPNSTQALNILCGGARTSDRDSAGVQRLYEVTMTVRASYGGSIDRPDLLQRGASQALCKPIIWFRSFKGPSENGKSERLSGAAKSQCSWGFWPEASAR